MSEGYDCRGVPLSCDDFVSPWKSFPPATMAVVSMRYWKRH